MNLYIKKIEDTKDTEYLNIYNELTEYQKSKIDKLTGDSKKLSLNGYLLLKEHNIDLKKITYNEYGKPLYPNINYSISHKDNITVLLTCNKVCGVDIENIKPYDLNVMKVFLNDEEMASVINSKNKETYSMIWAAKESYIKNIGLSLTSVKDIIINIRDLKIKSNDDSVEFDTVIYNDYVIVSCIRKNS